MSETESRYSELKKIQISASLKAEHIVHNLMQLLGYRQRVAQELLISTDERYTELHVLLEYTEEKIKTLLVL